MNEIVLERYGQYLKLNRDILIATSTSLVISAIFAQLVSGQADYLNTTYTLAVDYIVYFSTFGSLYYISNRKKYLLETGIDRPRLRRDLFRMITSLGVSEVIYTIVRWFLHYQLLVVGYDPYLASIISQGISVAVYLLSVNLSVKITRLFKDD